MFHLIFWDWQHATGKGTTRAATDMLVLILAAMHQFTHNWKQAVWWRFWFLWLFVQVFKGEGQSIVSPVLPLFFDPFWLCFLRSNHILWFQQWLSWWWWHTSDGLTAISCIWPFHLFIVQVIWVSLRNSFVGSDDRNLIVVILVISCVAFS